MSASRAEETGRDPSGGVRSGQRPAALWRAWFDLPGRAALAVFAGLASAALAAETEVIDAGAPGAVVERHVSPDVARTPWLGEGPDTPQGDTVEIRQVAATEVKTVKLHNVVAPIRFGSGEATIPADYVGRLRGILERMKDRSNVRLHFVGHSDNVPLHGALKDSYGDNLGLSRERAGTVAEFFQQALGLPAESISYEGRGESQPVADNAGETGRARNRRVEVEVWYDEVSEKTVEQEVVIAEEINRVKVCRVETVCKLRYKEGHAKRARIRNLVAPLHVDDETAGIPAEYHQKIRQALADLGGKQNVVVKFIGYTDDGPLGAREERIYGTHLGLSRARARRAALAVQDALGLPAAAIEVDGKGAAQPIASNDSDRGRSLNRRVEVEFWYDDALQELSDEPQLCPEDAGAETVTRVYLPPSGAPRPILFEAGKPVIEPGTGQRLRNAMADIRDKANVRLRFIGYTSNERLDRRTAMVYGDDIGLSAARARRAMEAIKQELGLKDPQAEFEGRGYVQSADVVNTGFVESDTSRVEIEVIYDELAALDDHEGLDITRLTREVEPKDPLALNTMRITVDGRPLDDPGKSVADIQRCTDVAMNRASIQFNYDNLDLKPRLNVSAWPASVRYRDDPDTEWPDNLVRFRAYSNYPAVIARAEVRLFDARQSERDTPLAVVGIGTGGEAEWQAEFADHAAPARELKYVLRVYDRDGRFDETRAQPLWVVDATPDVADEADPELRVGYGENRLAVENIRKRGGTVTVLGTGIPAGHTVWVAGRPVPVAGDGKFVAEDILPPGLHTVEVAVLDASGSGQLYLRDLELRRTDWFYVGIADLTVARDKTTGPARLVTQNDIGYNSELSWYGRLAFYASGKFAEGWGLTASADTLEGPAGELFSNFLDKSPGALFRRIDPDYYYPTYGDDGTVEEGAPTLGKFYLKLRKDESYGLWGNFKIGYTDNELAHVDRGLYGANLHYETLATTGFGEKRFLVDGFAAEPGTIAGRDEFLGTGGSLYYLRHQDILTGSERVRVEIRDKDSGIVVGVKNLTPVLDYSIDYLQGRVVLGQPLSPIAADDLLVKSDSTSGNLAYLVVRYEYSPGFSELNAVAVGGRSHLWLGDYVKIGITADQNEQADEASALRATDITVRKSADSWVKLAMSRSEGPGQSALTSNDGGFNFDTIGLPPESSASAGASRFDASLALGDVVKGAGGRVTLYSQSLDAGYSAPGQVALTDTRQSGGTLRTPLGAGVSLNTKLDQTVREQGLNTSAAEVDLGMQIAEHWGISAGVRKDRREDTSPLVPLTQAEGDRTDAVVRATYDTRGRWLAYGYVQDTLSTSGNREENGRVGSGGSLRVTDRLNINGEVSGGDLGTAGQFGTEYLYTDRTSLYLTYLLDNESVADTGVRAKKGSLVTGARTRYSDAFSVYLEEKYTHGDVPTGLTHAAGVDIAPSDRWNFGASFDAGTLRDPNTGATMERSGLGLRVGYGVDAVKLSSAVEYRTDVSQQPDLSVAERETWLFKNGLKYQITPDWRLLGKLNHAFSTSSLGSYYDGRYTEAVIGYGYRPVDNDRLNTLFKYTYFFNLPSSQQVTGAGTAADFLQESHILSFDVVYELTRSWTLGAKYGYRLGRVSLDREDPEFFDSSAHLYVVRADWEFVRHWEAMVEARLLEVIAAGDRRSGFLAAIYRHLGNNVKLGVGYNFTDFSDDLTNLNYNSHGLFINAIGKI